MQRALRIAIVIGGAAALAASASSSSQQQPQQRGYYPRPPGPQQPQQTGYAPPYQNQPQTGQTFSPCESACGQIARCNVMRYDACINECVSTNAAAQPGGADQLNMIARSSCQQIQAAMASSGTGGGMQTGAGGGQWSCSASGSWQKCEPNGSSCRPQTTNGFGVGATEQLARGAAETQCTTYMTNLMTASFAFRTSIAASCRATTCTPR